MGYVGFGSQGIERRVGRGRDDEFCADSERCGEKARLYVSGPRRASVASAPEGVSTSRAIWNDSLVHAVQGDAP